MSKQIIKSPLRYPGGKSRAVELITRLIPDFQEYREPFIGGGSVFIHLKQLYPTKQFWINDIYTELYCFWKESQAHLPLVIEQVRAWRAQYEDGKELYRYLLAQMPTFSTLEIASAFFIFNRVTFSGTTEAGGYSQQAFKARFTESSIERLAQLEHILPNTAITNEDYQTVVEREGEGVFIFLDPPYYAATKSALYGKRGKLHKTFDHERFATTMQQCGHSWLITYDDSAYIRDLFSFANIYEWKLMYGMRNQTATSNQEGSELFISNYPLELPTNKKTELLLF